MSDIMEQVPAVLRELLKKEYGDAAERIESGFVPRPVTLRANALKASADEVARALASEGFAFERLPWWEDAFLLPNAHEADLWKSPLYVGGKIYLQSLSSMLPPLYLSPRAGESVLDMTAAPGGKTCELAALSEGKALITACEKDKVRFGRMKYNLARQGAGRVNAMQTDALALSDYFRFDKILLDAPCSGSGTLVLGGKSGFSLKTAEHCARLQKALLKKGIALLKEGGLLLYSTCSVLKEENEGAIESVLAEGGVRLVPLNAYEGLPLLPGMEGTLTVCPDGKYEGFFLAMLRKESGTGVRKRP